MKKKHYTWHLCNWKYKSTKLTNEPVSLSMSAGLPDKLKSAKWEVLIGWISRDWCSRSLKYSRDAVHACLEVIMCYFAMKFSRSMKYSPHELIMRYFCFVCHLIPSRKVQIAIFTNLRYLNKHYI